ncbi:hypothetical protein NQZ68_037848 [Dissostichus eleginoides]|nr:hypothetical protein NQZ68_037848 [Dissostichus eleginoides]
MAWPVFYFVAKKKGSRAERYQHNPPYHSYRVKMLDQSSGELGSGNCRSPKRAALLTKLRNPSTSALSLSSIQLPPRWRGGMFPQFVLWCRGCSLSRSQLSPSRAAAGMSAGD